jgi:CHASE2 domain-containing sensor protein
VKAFYARPVRSIGTLFILTGIVSLALMATSYKLIWLLWIDQWGREVGIGLRAGILVLGVVIWAIAKRREMAES